MAPSPLLGVIGRSQPGSQVSLVATIDEYDRGSPIPTTRVRRVGIRPIVMPTGPYPFVGFGLRRPSRVPTVIMPIWSPRRTRIGIIALRTDTIPPIIAKAVLLDAARFLHYCSVFRYCCPGCSSSNVQNHGATRLVTATGDATNSVINAFTNTLQVIICQQSRRTRRRLRVRVRPSTSIGVCPHAAVGVEAANGPVPHKSIEIEAPVFIKWVLAAPPPCARVVISIPVINQVRLIILIFGGEPERICLGHGAGGAEEFPEGAFEASPWVPGKPMNMKGMRRKPITAGISGRRSWAHALAPGPT